MSAKILFKKEKRSADKGSLCVKIKKQFI